MMWPLRWAEHNAFLVRFASHRDGALNSPDKIVLTVVGIFCVLLSGWIVSRLYMQASRLRLFPWMPYAMFLLIAFFEYVLHVEQNFIYPYDLPSLLFFTIGIWAIYERRFWALLLLFPIGCLNREIMIFLVPILLLDACCLNERVEWKRALQPLLLLKAATLSAIWLAVRLYVHHRFRNNDADAGVHTQVNWTYLTHPQYWPQLLSIGAFLPVFVVVFWKRIPDFRLRMYLWIFLPWLAVMCYYGMLVETRIFGELTSLLAVTATLLFESMIWSMVRERLGVAVEV